MKLPTLILFKGKKKNHFEKYNSQNRGQSNEIVYRKVTIYKFQTIISSLTLYVFTFENNTFKSVKKKS